MHLFNSNQIAEFWDCIPEELMLSNCGAGEKTLKSPLDSKEIKPVNPEYSLEGLMLKLQYFGHLM